MKLKFMNKVSSSYLRKINHNLLVSKIINEMKISLF